MKPKFQASNAPKYLVTAAVLPTKGVYDVVCVSVNDPFLMGAFENAIHGMYKERFVI